LRSHDRTTADVAFYPAPATTERWQLVVTAPGAEPRILELVSPVELLFGRAPACHVVVDHDGVSRRHARLARHDDELVIEDLGSRNGTLVNGKPLAGTRALAPGDTIAIGPVTAVVVAPGGARSVRPARSAGELGVVMADPRTADLFALAERAAASTIAVLIAGETGTGKEVVAEAVHRMSPRADRPFVAVDCAALTDTLVESVLFGHERGAFTGAAATTAGFLEEADGGTLFLDEIGELSAAAQAKLLRALERRAVVRVGGTAEVACDFRLVCATRRDLHAEVAAGRFREDLYFRIGALVIAVPPLRERRGDIAPLARAFAGAAGIADAAIAALERYAWPGNVRELRNALEHARLMADDRELAVAHLPPRVRASAPATAPDDERAALVAALDAAGGNQSQAARTLGISRFALIRALARHGVDRRR
jgi:DNA-binding NtrC family response regulator